MKLSILEDIDNLIQEVKPGLWKHLSHAAGEGFKQGAAAPLNKAKKEFIKGVHLLADAPRKFIDIVRKNPKKVIAGVGGLYLYKKYYSDADKRKQTNDTIKSITDKTLNYVSHKPPTPIINIPQKQEIPEKSNLLRNGLISGGVLAAGAGGVTGYSYYKNKKNKQTEDIPPSR
jgi:hypothetical protein